MLYYRNQSIQKTIHCLMHTSLIKNYSKQGKFDVPPIWDQDFSAKSIGEPTAVEKLVGLGVGNYKRLTIDYALVNDQRGGPF